MVILMTLSRGVFLLCILMFLEQDLRAYVDPGAGSFYLQMILAGGAGILFYVRRLLKRASWWK